MLLTSYSPKVNQRVQHVVLKTDDGIFTVEYMCMITGRTSIERYAVPLTKLEIEAEYDYILFPKVYPYFEEEPTQFSGTWINVQGRTMLWQENVIYTGYVYHP
jgi:hypothetical protein